MNHYSSENYGAYMFTAVNNASMRQSVKRERSRSPIRREGRPPQDRRRQGPGGGGGGGNMGAPMRRRRLSNDLRASPGVGAVGDTYGLNTTFLDSLNLKPPLVNRVFVTNVR